MKSLSAPSCLLLSTLLLAGATRPAAAQTAYGLMPSLAGISLPLVTTFDAATGISSATHFINGYTTGWPVGLDVRPATGQLYMLDYDSGNLRAQVFTLNPATGNATAVGPAFTLNLGSQPATTEASRIGFDFDPTTDRIRVTGGNGANYRLDPTTGTLAATDAPLAYAATDPNAGQTPVVGASAYTNSYAGSTSTTLYNIDEATGRLVTQSPATTGTLNTVAALGVITGSYQYTDLDIRYEAATQTNTAYFLMVDYAVSSNGTTLYKLNLTTGARTQLSIVGSPSAPHVIDIALATPAAALATRPTGLATELALYPNPSAGSLSLSFNLLHAAHAELVVTDLLGRPAATLDAGVLPTGAQTVRWARSTQAAGVYLVSLRLDGQPAGTCRAVLTQ